jgi:hypothetical protein
MLAYQFLPDLCPASEVPGRAGGSVALLSLHWPLPWGTSPLHLHVYKCTGIAVKCNCGISAQYMYKTGHFDSDITVNLPCFITLQ